MNLNDDDDEYWNPSAFLGYDFLFPFFLFCSPSFPITITLNTRHDK
jgi:hypothetical protein